MDDSTDGAEPATREEFVAVMMLLAALDRAAYRELRALAWNYAQPLGVSEKTN